MAEHIEFEATKQAIDRIRSVYHRARNFNAVSVIDNVFGEIKEIPAADVAPVVHEHWGKDKVYVKEYDDGIFLGTGHFGYRCSNCGGIFDRTKFCGGCGAKMDEEECHE